MDHATTVCSVHACASCLVADALTPQPALLQAAQPHMIAHYTMVQALSYHAAHHADPALPLLIMSSLGTQSGIVHLTVSVTGFWPSDY